MRIWFVKSLQDNRDGSYTEVRELVSGDNFFRVAIGQMAEKATIHSEILSIQDMGNVVNNHDIDECASILSEGFLEQLKFWENGLEDLEEETQEQAKELVE